MTIFDLIRIPFLQGNKDLSIISFIWSVTLNPIIYYHIVCLKSSFE